MKRALRWLTASAVAAAFLIIAGAAGAELPATWYVAPGGSDANSCAAPAEPCATINGAIGKAGAGDTVRVAVGTYAGTGDQVVLVDESVTLDGGWNTTFTDGTGASTIDGKTAAAGVVVSAGVSAGLEGFVIDGGGGAGQPSATGIWLVGSWPTPSAALTLAQTTVSSWRGTGIRAEGHLTMSDSAVSANEQGGVAVGGPYSGELTMVGSTISGNQGSGVVVGSGLNHGIAVIRSSTITANSGRGIYVYRGDLSGSTSHVELSNVTVSGNSSGGVEIDGVGHGLTTVTARDTVIAGNGQDVYAPWSETSVVSAGFNLVPAATSNGYVAGAGDITSASGLALRPLADNGGVTETMAPQPWSAVIDAGNPAGCTDETGAPLATDQRGAPRVGRCDIGAFEAVPPVNDAFAQAVALDGLTAPVGATNLYATKEAGEPWHGSDAGGASVWFSWAPSFTGTAYVSTTGSDFDTTLGVYAGSAVSSLTRVASNDDGRRSTSTSRACFPATLGAAYRIAVDGYGVAFDYGGSEGDIELAWGQYTGTDPCAVMPPTVVGAPAVGGALTATTGSWAGAVSGFEYQWIACVPAGFACYTIDGATGPSYSPTDEDVGYTLAVQVAAKHASDSSLDAVGYSLPTMPVPAPPSDGGGGGGGIGGATDLAVTGVVSPSSAPVGGSYVWRLKVANTGSGIARGVVLDVQLSSNVAYGFSQVTRGSGCVPAVGGYRCNLDLLGPAGSGSDVAEVVFGANVVALGEVSLTATASFAQTDPTAANNTLTLKTSTPIVSAPSPPLAVKAKPVFGKALAQPTQPLAGKRFNFILTVKRSDTGARLTGGRMVCDPTVAGRLIRHTESFKAGKARLTFLVPKTAKGKQLKIKVKIVSGSQSTTKVFTFKVR